MKQKRSFQKMWMMIIGVISCTLLMGVLAYARDYKESQLIYLNGKKSAYSFYDEKNNKEVVHKIRNASMFSLISAEYQDVEVVENTDPENLKVVIYKSDGSICTDGKDGYYMIFSFLKPTKATVRFTAVSGTTPVSYTIKFTAVKYDNPFKVLNIGSRKFASAFKKDRYVSGKIRKGVSGKLKIKLKKNWKIKKVMFCASNEVREKKVKSTARISFKNKTGYLIITLKNTKYGYTEIFTLA